mgnify:FL=1
MLTSKQISYLKSLSHKLKPVVIIGNKGLSESVSKEIETNLDAHELIKIQIKEESKVKRDLILNSLCEKIRAERVNHIGRQFVIFKATQKSKITLP